LGSLRSAGTMGWISCTFTPRGLSHWTAAVFNQPGRKDTACFHATTRQNPFAPPAFYDTIRGQVTSAYAEQELEGRFISVSGGLFKRLWFEIVPAAPAGIERVCRAWDLAATVPAPGRDPDYTVGAKLGWHAGVWYVLDIRRGQTSPEETERTILQTAILDGRDCMMRMEQEGGASGKSLVDHYSRNVLSGFSFKGIHPSGDKQTRAMPFAAAAESGNVKLIAAPWNKEYLDELESFGPDAKHDDQVDATSLAHESLAVNLHTPGVTAGIQSGRIARLTDDILAEYNAITDPEQKLIAWELLKKEGLI
jgi:predicted phage terminase large subunit-like protein